VQRSTTVLERYRVRTIIIGAMTFSISYALTVGITLGFARDVSDLSDLQVALLIPGAGPLIALGPLFSERCAGLAGLGCALGRSYGIPLFIMDGIAQIAGIGVFIAGLTQSTTPEPYRPGPNRTRLPWWTLAPGAPGSPLGLTITGQYF
jgi:hypothetical protein